MLTEFKDKIEMRGFGAAHWILDRTHEIIKISNFTLQQVQLYFKSDAYEEDLDYALELLHINRPSPIPDLELIRDRKTRVLKKTELVKTQVATFIKMSAVIGGEIGAKMHPPTGAVEGIVIGTATGFVIVSVVAGHIMLRRLAQGNNSSFSIEPVNRDDLIALN